MRPALTDADLARILRNPRKLLSDLDKADSEESLLKFIKYHWKILEPTQPFATGWALEAICEHLEAVTYGEINRLLLNVPPGFMKSLATDVFWPAWEWGPKNMPSMRYLSFSYSASLTERDNNKFRALIRSPEYQEKWADKFGISPVAFNTVKAENTKTGWKLATSVGGVGTGERGDRVIIDDPHNVKDSESDTVRDETVRWFRESLQTRLNNPDSSAIVVIMQRVHESDVSGTILAGEMGYTHCCIPMEYDGARHCVTSIGWEDPRTDDGELAFPERYSPATIKQLKNDMSDYAIAGQFQQAPTPRGGGMLKSDWWKVWPPQGEDFDERGKPLKPLDFPQMEYIVASLDTAMTTKEENDYSALSIMGVWFENKHPKIMLMSFWQDRLDFHSLIEKVKKTCRARQVDVLLVEAKNNGFSVAQEIVRLCGAEEWNTILEPVKGDKLARAYSIQHLLRNGLVYAPVRAWADLLIDQCSTFPRGAHDDGPDCFVQGLAYLRRTGLLQTTEESQAEQYRAAVWTGSDDEPLYDV